VAVVLDQHQDEAALLQHFKHVVATIITTSEHASTFLLFVPNPNETDTKIPWPPPQ
jgi:hypothetical protein